MFGWLKDTNGSQSASLTFAALAFVVCLFKFLVSGCSVNLWKHDISGGQVDAASIAALLAPTLGAYVARRHSEVKYGDKPPTDLDDADVPPPAHDPKG